MMKKYNILYQIKTLEKMIFRKFIKNNSLNKNIDKLTPSTPTQLQIISYIIENPNSDIYQKDLENILNLRRATVSGVLQTMEKNNLIERIVDEHDTRTKKIILKEEVRKDFLKHKNTVTNLEKEIIKNIDEKDLETFSKVIAIMKENINNIK